MNLEKHLVLSKYFLHLAGYTDFDSATPYQKINKHWNRVKEDYKTNHILFQEANQHYLNELFEGKI